MKGKGPKPSASAVGRAKHGTQRRVLASGFSRRRPRPAVVAVVANRIMARGEVPYLHAFANNAAAIRLYESIGFRLRSAMNIAVVQRAR